MKRNICYRMHETTGGFAYISDTEIQSFYSSLSNPENISEHKYKRRKLNKAASAPEPGVVRKRGRPRKHPLPVENYDVQMS